MKVRVSMPGAYMAVEFEEDEAVRAFRKLNEVLLSVKAGKSVPPAIVVEPKEIEKDITLLVEAMEVPQEKDVSVEPEDSGLRYKGFLYLKCPECGEVHGFCTKEYMTYYKCRSCGHKMPFERPLVKLWINCECGKQARYMTNMTETEFDIPCFACGAPVAVTWNEKKGLYEPIRDETL